MVLLDYFDSMSEAIEYLIAFGSIAGILLLIFGIFLFRFGSNKMRGTAFGVIICGILLIGICGVQTGVKYFRIF